MRIEADNLQAAFTEAAEKLNCSVTELDIKVIQHPRGGFLGMFKKSAIIEVIREGDTPVKEKRKKKEKKAPVETKEETVSVESENISTDEQQSDSSKTNKRKRNRRNKNRRKPKDQENIQKEQNEEVVVATKEENSSETKEKETKRERPRYQREVTPKVEMSVALPQIKEGVEALIKNSCFDINEIKVEEYNEDVVLIECNGEDAALLIGKEGYRYKAFSYLLYNWINIKYGLGVRLEIAEFLKNQEEMIEQYLVPVVERINNNGRGQTKPLDGVLIKIALEKLRNEFPEKYVGIKSNRDGGKFIVVNDFNRKNQ